jgi:16S rRNA (guanine966-N2)-methyltransferase
MRIVAGEKRGLRLVAPRGSATRPTSDRVREALFAMLADVSGDRVLDLFAGSGALGLEALSRGAAHADFCDTSAAAISACRQNVERLGYGDRTVVRRVDARRRLAADAAAGRTYDLMLIDPPYTIMDAMQQTLSLHIPQIVAPSGRVAIESAAALEPAVPGLMLDRTRVHGGTRITLLHHG